MKSCTLETGVYDYRKLIMSILRFAKGNSKTFYYRCFKNLDGATFEETLTNGLAITELLFANFMAVFNKNCTTKKRTIFATTTIHLPANF